MTRLLIIMLLFSNTIFAQYDTLKRTVSINIFNDGKLVVPGWTNWKPKNQTTAQSLSSIKWSDSTGSGVVVTLKGQGGLGTNPTNYPVDPPGIETSYATTGRELEFSGLDNSVLYDFSLLASRDKANQTTRVTVNGLTDTIRTYRNQTWLSFNKLKPVNNRLTIFIERVRPDYNYINAFTLTENRLVESNTPPVIVSGDTTLPFRDTVSFVSIQAYDKEDTVIKPENWKWEYIGSTQAYQSNGATLIVDRYNYEEVYKVTVTDSKGLSTSKVIRIKHAVVPEMVIKHVNLGIFGIYYIRADNKVLRVQEGIDPPKLLGENY